MMNKFTIIIPIFNETESIFKLIEEIFYEFKKITPEIIIIDDGSTDDFQRKFKVKKLKRLKFININPTLENVRLCIPVYKKPQITWFV